MKAQYLSKVSLTIGLVVWVVSSATADVLLVEDANVRRYTDDGTFLGTFVAGLNIFLSVARSEPGGQLFISQHGTGEIHKYDAEGMDLGAVLAGFPDWQPAGLAWNDGRLYAASCRYKALSSYAPDAGAEDGNSNTPEPQRVLECLPDAANGLYSAGTRGGVYFATSDEATGKGVLGHWAGTPGNKLQTIQTFTLVPAEAEAKTKSRRTVLLEGQSQPGAPIVHVRADLRSARLPFLNWDTEGGDRAKLNLLRAPVTLAARAGAKEMALTGTGELLGKSEATFQLAAPQAQITWTVQVKDGGIRMTFSGSGQGLANLQGLVLTIPLDPTAIATVPLADRFSRDGTFQLPVLVYAPDLGAMHVSCAGAPNLAGSWQGSRQTRSTTITLNLPVPTPDKEWVLAFEPWHLPQPKAMPDARVWQGVRRGWLNLLQVNSHRANGDFQHGIAYPEEPGGVWANNLVSDPVGSTVFWLADHVLLIPELAPDVSATSLLRRTVELWMNDGVSPEGQVYYVWRGGSPADSNPAVLIGAWAYVEASGDAEWIKRNAERLEFLSQYMERRDVDGDGLVESPQTGNRNSHTHGETAWDCISSGHKNAYVNALGHLVHSWTWMQSLLLRDPQVRQRVFGVLHL